MPSLHFKLLGCSRDSFNAIARATEKLPFDKRARRGFVMDARRSANLLTGKFYYVKTTITKQISPETLKVVEGKAETLEEIAFSVDHEHGLISTNKRRGDLGVLFEQFDAMPEVHVNLEDLNLNVKDYVFELQSAFNKNQIRAARIRDYQAREPMISNASFKILDDREAEKIIEKYQDNLEGASVSFKLPDGRTSFAVTRRGSLRFSDNAPDDLIRYACDCLPRFHEAEVETEEVVAP